MIDSQSASLKQFFNISGNFISFESVLSRSLMQTSKTILLNSVSINSGSINLQFLILTKLQLVFPHLTDDVWDDPVKNFLILYALDHHESDKMSDLLKANACIPTLPDGLLNIQQKDFVLNMLYQPEVRQRVY
jgi:hypothetical protein